ncbi:hypothetical protein ILUMI_08907 [Ignelater luminosus]|uniref:CAAX prenyl protease 2 n=1 Tax=Ignelater luminosus TaxID=2038154 RepID=A0A8K0GCZ2_IGNLU|nr:hypothetical protein ILUMI_08907 [Ignelater luminosus]
MQPPIRNIRAESRDHENVRMEHENKAIFDCFLSVTTCFVLSVIYVSSLYVWNFQYDRNHPSTIKRRFFSVFVMMFVSPVFLYVALNKKSLEKASIWEIMGFKTQGLIQAFFIPWILTMVLFMGPLCMQLISGLLKVYTEPMYWITNAQNLIWLRNHVVAPLSEEFTFRSCMLPLLLQSFNPITAIFLCPLFFGVAHFHHMIERMRKGLDFKTAFLISCFHFTYTTIFGTYSAFLLWRTGHFMSTFIAHAFCNHMGVPDIQELLTYKGAQRIGIFAIFIAGILLWGCLLNPLTEPSIYENNMIWNSKV